MPAFDYESVINNAMADPSTRAWAESEITTMVAANRGFWSNNPELIEELDSRGIAWVAEMNPSRLFEIGDQLQIVEALNATLYRVQDPVRLKILAHQFNYAPEPFDASALMHLFDQDGLDEVKREIAWFLPCSKAFDVVGWIVKVLKSPEYGIYRNDVAVQSRYVRGKKREPIIAALIEHFREIPAGAGTALAKMGGENELLVLRSMLNDESVSGPIRHWAEQAVKGIETRLAKRMKS